MLPSTVHTHNMAHNMPIHTCLPNYKIICTQMPQFKSNNVVKPSVGNIARYTYISINLVSWKKSDSHPLFVDDFKFLNLKKKKNHLLNDGSINIQVNYMDTLLSFQMKLEQMCIRHFNILWHI